MKSTVKKTSLIFSIVLIAISFLFACKKADEPGNWVRFNFIFDSKRTEKIGYTTNVSFPQGKMLFNGTLEKGGTIQIATDEAIVGSYLVENDAALAVVNIADGSDPLSVFAADSGSVTITTADLNSKYLQGVFDLWMVNAATEKKARMFGSFRTEFNF